MNVYLEQALSALPKIASMIDLNYVSTSKGVMDRDYWAWAIKDFPNGTFQGAVNGLSILNKLQPDNYISKDIDEIKLINTIIMATELCMNKDGSLNEAFPNEHSWCTTGLVAYDLLTTLKRLRPKTTPAMQSDWLKIISKLIGYVENNTETHGFISNHLLTNANALLLWSELVGDTKYEIMAKKILKKVLNSGKNEGWFMEYGGADPGYQTISMNYLANILDLHKDWVAPNVVEHSLQFLLNFANPDGSFAGAIGSRQTGLYFPAGIVKLAKLHEFASSLEVKMQENIREQKVVSLANMDNGNFVHLFNNYCEAANVRFENQSNYSKPEEFTNYYPGAGILVKSTPSQRIIISAQKGGIVQVFENGNSYTDHGLILLRNNKFIATTQGNYNNNIVLLNDEKIRIKLSFNKINIKKPNPYHFLILRVLSLTLFKNKKARELFKRIVVKRLILSNRKFKFDVVREVSLNGNVNIVDKYEIPKKYRIEANVGVFTTSHMASSGYWIQQDFKS